MTLDVHIVSHTHWDREWYHPLERFQQRLVALIDELLDDPPTGDESFLLDGQAIVIDDYLDVRPERATEMGELLRHGRLEAGPWYVLADELIPGGEALVRNLLAGRRALSRFNAEPPPVLYCPDSFGHPAALPAIAAGFGLALIVLWRGYGGSRWPSGDTVRWRSTGEDEALVFHLPRDGYEFGSHLPLDDDAARARWIRMRDELPPIAGGVTLIPHGADHHARPTEARRALDALERVAPPDRARRSSLRAFGNQLVESANGHSLLLVRGELRDSYGYTWSLQGTFATRAHEKRMNATAERLMTREAEPWSALASRHGPSGGPLVAHAWRTLLSAHPHDTLCGCSIDDVASAMELRIRSARTRQSECDDRSRDRLGTRAVAARDARNRWTPVVIVRNAAARVRSGVALLDVEQFEADVPVGPGSGAALSDRQVAVSSAKPRVSGLGALQVLSQRLAYSRTESPHHYPDNDLVSVAQVAAWVSDAPAYGIASAIDDQHSGVSVESPLDRVICLSGPLRTRRRGRHIRSRSYRSATSRQVAEPLLEPSTSATSVTSTPRRHATGHFAFCSAARGACIAGRFAASSPRTTESSTKRNRKTSSPMSAFASRSTRARNSCGSQSPATTEEKTIAFVSRCAATSPTRASGRMRRSARCAEELIRRQQAEAASSGRPRRRHCIDTSLCSTTRLG
jgi:hypothetical protein